VSEQRRTALAHGRNCVAALPDDVRWESTRNRISGFGFKLWNWKSERRFVAARIIQTPNRRVVLSISSRCYIEPAREEALDGAYLVSRGRLDKQLYAFRRIEKRGKEVSQGS
jgi:hypothetical protein